MTKYSLLPYQPEAGVTLEVAVGLETAADRSRVLALSYTLKSIAPFRAASPAATLFRDELWKTTCFEIFVMEKIGPAYEEWNFSPSGEWARYHFDAYRRGQRKEISQPPVITVPQNHSTLLKLEARIPLPEHPESLKLGLSSVVEMKTGDLSYWALRHASDRADFHDARGFSLSLSDII